MLTINGKCGVQQDIGDVDFPDPMFDQNQGDLKGPMYAKDWDQSCNKKWILSDSLKTVRPGNGLFFSTSTER